MKDNVSTFSFESYTTKYYDGPITKKIRCLFLFLCFPIVPFISCFPCDVKYQLIFNKEIQTEKQEEEEDYIMM